MLFIAGIIILSPETNSKLNLEFDPWEISLDPFTGIRIESLTIDIPSTEDDFKNSTLSFMAS